MADDQTISIDGTDYHLDDLSEAARNQIAHIRICDQKAAQLQAELGIVRTARASYAAALRGELPSEDSSEGSIEVTAGSADPA